MTLAGWGGHLNRILYDEAGQEVGRIYPMSVMRSCWAWFWTGDLCAREGWVFDTNLDEARCLVEQKLGGE